MLVILVCGAGGIAGQTASDGECMGVSGGSHEEIIHELLGRVVGVKSQELARSRLGYRMVRGEGLRWCCLRHGQERPTVLSSWPGRHARWLLEEVVGDATALGQGSLR